MSTTSGVVKQLDTTEAKSVFKESHWGTKGPQKMKKWLYVATGFKRLTSGVAAEDYGEGYRPGLSAETTCRG